MYPPKLIECVPNFSEGRDQSIIDAIAASIRETAHVWLLHIDSNPDANRTVMTFVGTPEQTMQAAFQAIKTAAELIDMRIQKGAHARIGATDVCPFIPVSGITMSDTIQLANSLAKRVGRELGIPVYLYENSATLPHRRNLASIRAGEYEGLKHKMSLFEWRTDFGPTAFQPQVGATVIGVRSFLIAYNVNLDTEDVAIARKIAGMIRESGIPLRNSDGSLKYNRDNQVMRSPGEFKAVKAVGWLMPSFKCTQVSMNLIDYLQSPPHLVFERIASLARSQGTQVTGSEIVGLVPEKAMLMAGDYFLNRKSQSSQDAKIRIQYAIEGLGLNDLYPFDPNEKILEYRLSLLIKEESSYT